MKIIHAKIVGGKYLIVGEIFVRQTARENGKAYLKDWRK